MINFWWIPLCNKMITKIDKPDYFARVRFSLLQISIDSSIRHTDRGHIIFQRAATVCALALAQTHTQSHKTAINIYIWMI